MFEINHRMFRKGIMPVVAPDDISDGQSASVHPADISDGQSASVHSADISDGGSA